MWRNTTGYVDTHAGRSGMVARLSEATGDVIPRGCCRNPYLWVQGPEGGSPGCRRGRIVVIRDGNWHRKEALTCPGYDAVV